VYAIDVAASRVYMVELSSEKVTEIKLPFVKSSAAVTVTPDDTLWFAVADQILRLDPGTLKVEAANIGLYTVGAMAADAAGRVWFSNESRQTVGVYDRPTHMVHEFPLSRRGAVTSMVIDALGTLWVGTDASELFSVRDGAVASTARLGSPVLSLTTDGRGQAWFLTNDPSGSMFGPVASPAAARLMPASVVGLWFDARADAWLADRTSAGFFIALPEPRP
jgi:streptogramin lyase